MRRVVFPDPFGPRITIISPSSTVKFSSRRASVFPYFFERLRVSTANKDEEPQEVSDKKRSKFSREMMTSKEKILKKWSAMLSAKDALTTEIQFFCGTPKND